MIPRECQCGHVMLEHEFNGRCLVTICSCERYDEKTPDPDPGRGGKPPGPPTVDQ